MCVGFSLDVFFIIWHIGAWRWMWKPWTQGHVEYAEIDAVLHELTPADMPSLPPARHAALITSHPKPQLLWSQVSLLYRLTALLRFTPHLFHSIHFLSSLLIQMNFSWNKSNLLGPIGFVVFFRPLVGDNKMLIKNTSISQILKGNSSFVGKKIAKKQNNKNI